MRALGQIATLAEGREVVRRSFSLTNYEPIRESGWEGAYAQLLNLLAE
jgi:hypothetical protein